MERQTTIENEGQEYVDDPVEEEGVILCGKEPILHKQVVRYERVRLKWMKPGPDGKLVPR
jgi:hypothetical protein